MALTKLHSSKPKFKAGKTVVVSTGQGNSAKAVKTYMDRVREQVNTLIAQSIKSDAKQALALAIDAIPDTGTGYTAKQTVVTTGKVKAPQSREDARTARARLRRRRGGDTGRQEKVKALARGEKKIDRTKDSRIAWLATNNKDVFKIGFGSYYAGSIKLKTGKTLRQEVSKRLNNLKVKS